MRVLMWLLDRITGSSSESPPRTVDEIRRTLNAQDAEHVERLNRVEESLLALTAEAGLEDLRRRMVEHRTP